jgi:hypothetical protein
LAGRVVDPFLAGRTTIAHPARVVVVVVVVVVSALDMLSII